MFKIFCIFAAFFLAQPLSAHRDRDITVADTKPDGRVVEVTFTDVVVGELPISLKPTVRSMQVELGKKYEVAYIFENHKNLDLPILATHSVEPAEAGSMFKKFVCFCFEEQNLKASTKVEMPIVFVISPNLPQHVKKLSINYRIYLKKEPNIKPFVRGKSHQAHKG